MADTVTHTLEVAAGSLVYDVTEGSTDGHRPLFLIGHPMGSSGFAALASHFPERTIVRYDPRGCERSRVADADHSPRQNAADVHQLIGLLGGGPVDVFGSSGGAVTGLALVAQHPDDVAILVAHEPPILAVLPDARLVREAFRQVTGDYHEHGFGAGMARFIILTSIEGEFTARHLELPAPGPSQVRASDQGRRRARRRAPLGCLRPGDRLRTRRERRHRGADEGRDRSRGRVTHSSARTRGRRGGEDPGRRAGVVPQPSWRVQRRGWSLRGPAGGIRDRASPRPLDRRSVRKGRTAAAIAPRSSLTDRCAFSVSASEVGHASAAIRVIPLTSRTRCRWLVR